MSRLNRLRTLGGLRGRALSGSDSIGNALRADVVAYYKLSDVSDSGPNGYTLTNNNSTSFGAGKIGNCATFNDAGDTSLSRAGSDLDITTTDFAFSFWIKTVANDDWVFTKVDGGPGYYCYTGANLTFAFQDADGTNSGLTVTSGVTINDNAWHYIVINGDRDGLQDIYCDSVLRASRALPGASTGSLAISAPFYLGRFSGTSDGLDGSLDEFGFWRRLLTAAEIAYLYASGSGIALY